MCVHAYVSFYLTWTVVNHRFPAVDDRWVALRDGVTCDMPWRVLHCYGSADLRVRVMSALLVRVERRWGERVSHQTSWSSLGKGSATRSRTILPLKSLGRLQTKVFFLNMFAICAFSLERAGSLVPIYLHTPLDEVVGKSEGFQWFESLDSFHTPWNEILSFVLSSC